jgi:hypothetical protein
VVEQGEAEALQPLLDRLVSDGGHHLLTGPAEEAELARVEKALGFPLPPSYRALLTRMGSGILYDRHEFFGPRQLMLHDIEFVPSLIAIQTRLGQPLPHGLVAFHRGGGHVHVFDLREGAQEPVPVRSLDGARSYPGFVAFVEAVVLPQP